MSLSIVLSNSVKPQIIYAVIITALKTQKFWEAIPVTGALGYQTAMPFDGAAYITNVFHNNSALTNVSSQSAVESTVTSWYWDRTNLFIRLSDDSNPAIEANTVTLEITYHFATQAKIFDGIYYHPFLISTPALSIRAQMDFSSVPQISGGSTVLDNAEGFFDAISDDLNWDGGQTTVMIGADQPDLGVEMSFSDYETIGTWLNDSWVKTDRDFTITNIERKYRLQQNIPQRLYSTDLYPSMNINDYGRPIPLAYGQIYGAAPTCIDIANKRFKVADHPIFSVDEIRMATSSNWQQVDYGTLDLANGEFTVPSWDGQSNVSVDFHGKINSNGTWMDNAADIVQDLLAFIGETKFEKSTFDASHRKLVIGLGSKGTLTPNVVPAVDLPVMSSLVHTDYDAALDAMTGDFTIEAWVFQSAQNVDAGIVSRDDQNNTNGPFYLGFVTGTDSTLVLQLNGGSFFLYGNAIDNPVPVGSWVHVAATRSGSTVRVFVNGKICNTDTYGTAISYSGEQLNVGVLYSPTHWFNGLVSEVRLSTVCRYDSDFTPADFLFADGDTILYWKMDEGTGSTVADTSVSGISGTLMNGAIWGSRTAALEISAMTPSLYLNDSVTGLSVIEKIDMVVGSVLFVDANGYYRYVVFEPTVGEDLDYFEKISILKFSEEHPSIQEQSRVTAIFSNRMQDGWGQVLTVEKVANQYAKGQPNAVLADPVIIPLSNFDDADYWVKRQLIFLGETPKLFTVELPWQALLMLPTKQIRLVYPRHNLDVVLEVIEVGRGDTSTLIKVGAHNMHNFSDQVGFWVEDTDVLPTRFAGLPGYGSRTDGQPDGSLVWYDAWDPLIKTWANQNVGYWTEDDGFIDDLDEDSYLVSTYF